MEKRYVKNFTLRTPIDFGNINLVNKLFILVKKLYNYTNVLLKNMHQLTVK